MIAHRFTNIDITEVTITDGVYCSNIYSTNDMFKINVQKDFTIAGGNGSV